MNRLQTLSKKTFLLFLLLFTSMLSFAQEDVEMADKFVADGKIYVVLAVVGVILGILFFGLFRLDRNIKKIEKQLTSKNI